MTQRTLRIAKPVLITATLATVVWLNAGDLNPPPGPVSPTMKPLTQVEPRIAINAMNTPGDADSVYRITQAGSYYLTGHVIGANGKRGIEIAFSGVTIDLMGFGVRGAAGSLEGIATDGGAFDNLTIRNGIVSNWDGDGIALSAGGLGSASLIEGVLATSNGNSGIACNRLGIIRNCATYLNGGAGISGGTGGHIECCTAYLNDGDGILLGTGATINGCSARLNGGSGIVAGSGRATIIGCSASSNGVAGIEVASNSLISQNTCDSNVAGIQVTGDGNRIEGNNVTDNTRGIDVDFEGNFIVRNTARGNTTQYDIVADNVVGVIFQGTLSPAISGATGGSGVGSEASWSNFSY
ncbi:MAG TPA: right-handed parallel beta-helix repeat-containing protein [Phycisphaerae bacterium]|jgi:parallel beta-helix repeat protein